MCLSGFRVWIRSEVHCNYDVNYQLQSLDKYWQILIHGNDLVAGLIKWRSAYYPGRWYESVGIHGASSLLSGVSTLALYKGWKTKCLAVAFLNFFLLWIIVPKLLLDLPLLVSAIFIQFRYSFLQDLRSIMMLPRAAKSPQLWSEIINFRNNHGKSRYSEWSCHRAWTWSDHAVTKR